jgi:lisH motif-containing protein
MDYLIFEGYASAAMSFCDETGIALDLDVADMQARFDARCALLHGNVPKAMELANDVNPEVRMDWQGTRRRYFSCTTLSSGDAEQKIITIFRLIVAWAPVGMKTNSQILDTNALLFFRLQQLSMIELLRQGQTEAALGFAAEQLGPLGEEHPHLLDELERTMTLFMFDMDKPGAPTYTTALQDLSFRRLVADELNLAMLTAQSCGSSNKLLQVLRLCHASEKRLKEKDESIPSIALDATSLAVPGAIS